MKDEMKLFHNSISDKMTETKRKATYTNALVRRGREGNTGCDVFKGDCDLVIDGMRMVIQRKGKEIIGKGQYM